MISSPPIDDRPEARYSCWITAGSAHDRTGLSDWPALAPPIWSCTVRSTGLYQHLPPSSEPKRSRRPLPPDPLQPASFGRAGTWCNLNRELPAGRAGVRKIKGGVSAYGGRALLEIQSNIRIRASASRE
jgi:hypothetical protein